MEEEVYIALGSNLGDRYNNISEAVRMLDGHPQVRVLRVSSMIETEPHGSPSDQPKFINGALMAATTLSPEELLGLISDIESALGRVREIKNGPRTIDLDILLYGKKNINLPYLTIPHPRMFDRDFVMIPLNEIYTGEKKCTT